MAVYSTLPPSKTIPDRLTVEFIMCVPADNKQYWFFALMSP
uniref:Uncharacterized protein n=1 Tax=Anguilla anguilla TaxID=7936 RepID=A0A0E9VMJ9_ANGAN